MRKQVYKLLQRLFTDEVREKDRMRKDMYYFFIQALEEILQEDVEKRKEKKRFKKLLRQQFKRKDR